VGLQHLEDREAKASGALGPLKKKPEKGKQGWTAFFQKIARTGWQVLVKAGVRGAEKGGKRGAGKTIAEGDTKGSRTRRQCLVLFLRQVHPASAPNERTRPGEAKKERRAVQSPKNYKASHLMFPFYKRERSSNREGTSYPSL